MPCTSTGTPELKLSICITTRNRAVFIGETLESIITQLTADCEVVVLDAASSDDTERVVSEWALRCNRLRYIRQEKNNGIDRDYDRVVELARGEYCWLVTDDDVLKRGAVATVGQALGQAPSLIVVNWEVKDASLSKILWPRLIKFESDRVYRPEEMDRLFTDLGAALRYIGGIIVNRSLWMSRARERYYGSLYIHVGVIFQKPLPRNALVISEPCISFRHASYAAHTYSHELFATVMVYWPTLVWSLAISDVAKGAVCSSRPWRQIKELLFWRAVGFYSLVEYRRYIQPKLLSIGESLVPVVVAVMPGSLVNGIFVLYYSTVRSIRQEMADLLLPPLRESRFYIGNWRFSCR